MTLAIEAAVSSNSLLPLPAPSLGNTVQPGTGSFAATVISMLESISQPAVGNAGAVTGAIGVSKTATTASGGISGGGKCSTKNEARIDPALAVNPATLLNVPATSVLTFDALLPGMVLAIPSTGPTPTVDQGSPRSASTSVRPQILQGAPFGILRATDVQKIGSDATTLGVQPAPMMVNSAAQMQVSADASAITASAASANPSTSSIASLANQKPDAASGHGSVQPILVSAVAKQVTTTNFVPPNPAGQIPAHSQIDTSTVSANTTLNASVTSPNVASGPVAAGSVISGSTTSGSVASIVMNANSIQNNGVDSATIHPSAAVADTPSVAGSNPDYVSAEVPQVLTPRVAIPPQPTLVPPPAQASPPESSAIQVETNDRHAESLLASAFSPSAALTVAADPQTASSPRDLITSSTVSSNGPDAWLQQAFSAPVSVNAGSASNFKPVQIDPHRVDNVEQNLSPFAAAPQSMSSANVSVPAQVPQSSATGSKVPGEARQSIPNSVSAAQTVHPVVVQASAPSASVSVLPGTAIAVSTPTALKPAPSAVPQPTMAHEILELPAVSVPGPVHMAQIINKLGQSEIHIGLNTSAFGSVEVHTVVHASDVGLMIGSEKGDLRSLLANEMPGIAHTMQQQNLRLNSVSFQQGFSASSNSSGGGDSPPRGSHPTFIGAVDSAIAVTNLNDSVEPEPAGFSSTPGSLSILV